MVKPTKHTEVDTVHSLRRFPRGLSPSAGTMGGHRSAWAPVLGERISRRPHRSRLPNPYPHSCVSSPSCPSLCRVPHPMLPRAQPAGRRPRAHSVCLHRPPADPPRCTALFPSLWDHRRAERRPLCGSGVPCFIHLRRSTQDSGTRAII